VRAALELWTERGFENGIEETTVEEIVKVAGVTKGTFYFHFARKEEILLEMGWETAEIVCAEAEKCIKADRGLEDTVARLISVITSRVRAAPPAAVARSVSEFRRRPTSELAATGRVGFVVGFEMVFARAQEVGELPDEVASSEIAKILSALVMDSILDWTDTRTDLKEGLRLRASILVAGLKQPAVMIE
jgi:AcrR family transcriptional regulator